MGRRHNSLMNTIPNKNLRFMGFNGDIADSIIMDGKPILSAVVRDPEKLIKSKFLSTSFETKISSVYHRR